MNSIAFPMALACANAESVFQAGETGQVWRVVEGLVRLDRDKGPDRQPVQIAVPGDLIGTEALCQQPYRFNATALTPCRLEVVNVADAEAHGALLKQALMQQQLRSQDMAALRTGTVLHRITHFLHLLGIEWAGLAQLPDAEVIRASLPTLREMAQVVDAKRETVCRVLGQVLPPRRYNARPVPQLVSTITRGRTSGAWMSASMPV
jgi:CRP-like cAMP-binding protein